MKEKLNISVTDIDLYRNHIYNKDKLKSLDVNSRFKRFRFSYNGLLINLDNITVRAYMIKPDKKEIFNDLSIVNENIVELEFTNQALLVPGTLKLELVLYEDDAELSSFLIEYEVVKSLRTDNSIESANEYTSLQISLQKIERWNKNYQKLYDKWNTDLSNLHSSKNDILDTLKNTWDAEFRKKYDGLNKEYSNRVSSIEDDISSVKLEGLNLKSSLDKEYCNRDDFKLLSQEDGYHIFPGGFIIQWGRKNVSLNNEWVKGGTIELKKPFTSIFSIQSNVVDSNFDDPVHGRVSVRRNTNGACTQLPFTIIDTRMTNKTGVYAFDWFAIGLA